MTNTAKSHIDHSKRNRRGGSPRKQRGFIISVLLALVVGAIIAVIFYNQYSDSNKKVRVEAAVGEITPIIASAQKVYGSVNQYGAVTTAIAVRTGVIPERMRVGTGTTAQNRYYGAVTFTPATITTANDSLTLGYDRVAKDDCQELVINLIPLARRIQVGTTDVKPADAQINVATLATACDAAATSLLNVTFGRGQ